MELAFRIHQEPGVVHLLMKPLISSSLEMLIEDSCVSTTVLCTHLLFPCLKAPLTSFLKNQECLNSACLFPGASLCYRDCAFPLVSFWQSAVLVFSMRKSSGHDRFASSLGELYLFCCWFFSSSGW